MFDLAVALNLELQIIDGCMLLWQVFVGAYSSVAAASKRMLEQMGRPNYVTPARFLETVRSYRYAMSYHCVKHRPALHH